MNISQSDNEEDTIYSCFICKKDLNINKEQNNQIINLSQLPISENENNIYHSCNSPFNHKIRKRKSMNKSKHSDLIKPKFPYKIFKDNYKELVTSKMHKKINYSNDIINIFDPEKLNEVIKPCDCEWKYAHIHCLISLIILFIENKCMICNKEYKINLFDYIKQEELKIYSIKPTIILLILMIIFLVLSIMFFTKHIFIIYLNHLFGFICYIIFVILTVANLKLNIKRIKQKNNIAKFFSLYINSNVNELIESKYNNKLYIKETIHDDDALFNNIYESNMKKDIKNYKKKRKLSNSNSNNISSLFDKDIANKESQIIQINDNNNKRIRKSVTKNEILNHNNIKAFDLITNAKSKFFFKKMFSYKSMKTKPFLNIINPKNKEIQLDNFQNCSNNKNSNILKLDNNINVDQ